MPILFEQVTLKNCSTKNLKICLILFTFIHIFGMIFLVDIHSAVFWMKMDLILSLRCFIDVNAFFRDMIELKFPVLILAPDP